MRLPWVVDTSVLLDVHLEDPNFVEASAKCLTRYLGDGLVIAPITFIELAPSFDGDPVLEQRFLEELGVEWHMDWLFDDTLQAHQLWALYVTRISRQKGAVINRKRLADTMIEAFAGRYSGLITRNPDHFRSVNVVVP